MEEKGKELKDPVFEIIREMSGASDNTKVEVIVLDSLLCDEVDRLLRKNRAAIDRRELTNLCINRDWNLFERIEEPTRTT
jgi:hypothetical protein